MKEKREDLRKRKQASRVNLEELLASCADELKFYEVNQHCFFGSWFGWRARGGYIHVSNGIWGVNIKLCPSQSYCWDSDDPGPDYNAYRQGIDNLLESACPFLTSVRE